MTATFPELRGRVVLVTGAASGIGAGIAEAFRDQGATVVGADLSFEGTDAASGKVHLDVSDRASVDRAFAAVEESFGAVEVAVNAAGTSTMAYAIDTTEAEWDRNLDVNAKGSLFVAQRAARAMQASGTAGRIILIASQAAKNGYRGMSAYVASKHAVLGLTRTLAIELAPDGILVNAICPGIIETPMKHRERHEGAQVRGVTAADIEAEDRSQVPLGRTGTTADVAGVALFLASDLASYLTGQGLNVTGGMTMH